jgi:hypothetical protein
MKSDKNRSDEFVEAFINLDVKRQELPLKQEAERLEKLKYERYISIFEIIGGAIGGTLAGVIAYIADLSLLSLLIYILYGLCFGSISVSILGMLYKILCKFYKWAKA